VAGQADPGGIFVQYRPRRWLRWVLPAGLAGVLLLAGVGFLFRTAVGTPESTVAAYFAALADRDLPAALRLTAPEVDPARDMITEAVLRSPDYSPPVEVAVSPVSAGNREAVVRVRFVIDDRRYEVEQVRLRRAGGGLRAGWQVIDAFGSIRLRAVPEQVTVNGQLVAAYDAAGARFLDALPGGYQVGVPDGDPLWEPRSVPARVAPSESTEVDTSLVPRPGVREAVERQVVQLLDQCAAATELAPPGCPFAHDLRGTTRDVQWEILRYPNLGVTAAGGDTDRPVAVVRTARDGEAVVTGTDPSGDRFEAAVRFPVTGTVTTSGGTVVFQPGW